MGVAAATLQRRLPGGRGHPGLGDNPFPAVHGRVCYHPCETGCNRAQLDSAVSIHAVERFLGDMATAQGWVPRITAAPNVVLCGQGPKTSVVSKLLTLQQGRIPVFIKQAASRWEFRGAFQVLESLSSGARFESFVSGSGRSIGSVSHVVFLKPSP